MKSKCKLLFVNKVQIKHLRKKGKMEMLAIITLIQHGISSEHYYKVKNREVIYDAKCSP